MTREQLLALGLTEDQVNQIMGLHGTATQGLRTQVSTLTADLAAARAITNPNPPNPNPASPTQTDPPANDTELQNALNRIKELERENTRKDIAAYASSKGLSGEQAQNVLNAFGDDIDSAKGAIDSIAQIISDNRAEAAQEKEQEIARNASNPNGGNGGNGGGDEKSNAEKLASKYFAGKKHETNILSHYVSGGN